MNDTPRTNQLARSALDFLQACQNAEDYKEAVKAIVSELLDGHKLMERELNAANKCVSALRVIANRAYMCPRTPSVCTCDAHDSQRVIDAYDAAVKGQP